jgi:hypothetical protein
MCHTFTLYLFSLRRAGINILEKLLGTRWKTKEVWFDSQQEHGNYLFSETSRRNLGRIQAPTQYVLKYLSLKIK